LTCAELDVAERVDCDLAHTDDGRACIEASLAKRKTDMTAS